MRGSCLTQAGQNGGKNGTISAEGCLWNTVENAASLRNAASLQESWREGRILEARVTLCDSGHNLIVDLVSMKGIIPKRKAPLESRTVLPKISP